MVKTTVKVNHNGPILVRGDFELQDGDGKTFERDLTKPVALCRCGLSQNPPFCDGAHGREGFQSEVKAG